MNYKQGAKSAALAGVGGAVVGGAAYAIENVESEKFTTPWKAAALAAGGLILGAGLASAGSPSSPAKSMGAGLAGAGVGIATLMLIKHYRAAKSEESVSAIQGYAYNKFGHTQGHPSYHHLPYADYPQMGAVQAELGAVQADLSAVQAELY